MKIMKVLDKKVGDKTYFKYRINLPVKIAEGSEFVDKDLKVKFSNNRIVIEKE